MAFHLSLPRYYNISLAVGWGGVEWGKVEWEGGEGGEVWPGKKLNANNMHDRLTITKVIAYAYRLVYIHNMLFRVNVRAGIQMTFRSTIISVTVNNNCRITALGMFQKRSHNNVKEYILL